MVVWIGETFTVHFEGWPAHENKFVPTSQTVRTGECWDIKFTKEIRGREYICGLDHRLNYSDGRYEVSFEPPEQDRWMIVCPD